MPVEIILLPRAESAEHKLREGARYHKRIRSIHSALLRKIEWLKTDVHYGQVIARRLIPEEYKNMYQVKNLFRVELPLFWRLLYTIRSDDTGEIIVFVLDILNHKDYDKLFRYKKK